MIRLTATIALGLSVLLSEPSLAVVLNPVRGDVTINQGSGFRRVTEEMQVNVGDAVMVGPGDSAWLVYDDSCVVEVKSGAVVTVAGVSPCEAPSDTTPPPTEISGAALGVGLGGAAAAAVILILLNNKKDDPASP